MPVAAVIDKCRLQRRLDPGDFREVNIAPELLLTRGFVIKFLDAITFYDDDPGLLRMRRID